MSTAEHLEDDLYEEDDYDDFDEDEEGGLSGLAILAIGVAAIAVFGFVVWVAYQQGVKTGRSEGVPYVAADPDPVKVERDVPDPLAGRDPEVYDRIADGRNSAPEVLDPPAREGAAPAGEDPVAELAARSETQAAARETTPEPEPTPAEEPAAAAPAETRPAPSPTPKPQRPARTAQTRPEPEPEPEPQPARVETRLSSASSAPKETTSAPAASPSASSGAGNWLVQIGAFRSEEEAVAQWDRYRAQFPTISTGVSRDIERADLGAKGVYYRLRVGPFTSKSAATSHCGSLDSGGMSCFIKSK